MSGETKSSDHDARLPDVSFQFSTSLWRHSDERRITRGGCGERCVNCSCRDIGPELLNLCCLRCRETNGSRHDAQCDQRQPQPDALETSAADAKQQQPGWTEAADVDQWHIREALKAIIARNQYLQLKAFCHWVRRKNAAQRARVPSSADDMLEDWSNMEADIMSPRSYQRDTR